MLNAILFPYHPRLRESTLVADHEEGGGVAAAHEVVEVERLTEDEVGAVEAVAGFELGVLALHHQEVPVAEMAEQHAAVGCPRDAHEPLLRDLVRLEGAAEHGVRRFARACVVGQEVVPVVEAHAPGEDGEGGVASGVVAIHVAPDTFEGGDAEGLLAAFLDDAGEELEVRGALHLAGDGCLHHFAEL